ncbi:hypothetical protein HNW13_017985 [Shewanella sp. BF02_Schw]|uniref:DNA replication terminus site-binding protein n=1 Tax=Shewanella sp. BF02_Schw TaxID=394908 RepID=UPI00177E7FED|nr:DNA replication terminus site-binding protein [Shewanella sp. BF02_Schw]MBO1897630.1 hypothetical protein [Shewanella sp. BF02_Schw]
MHIPNTFTSEKTYSQCIEFNLATLKGLVEQLNGHLDNLKIKSSRVYQIEEALLENQNNAKLTNAPQEAIKVTYFDDFIAYTEAKKSYLDFYNHPGTTSKNTYRAAGFIQISIKDNIDDNLTVLINLCSQVNTQKKVIADLFKAVVTLDDDLFFDREKFFITYFPHLIKLQVTRQIRLINEGSISSIDFHWSSKTLSDKTNVTDMMQKIDRMTERLNKSADFSANIDLKVKSLGMTYKLLSMLPANVELRLRRPIPPQPSVNIRRANDKPINFTCPIPFILISDEIEVTGLKEFMPKSYKINSKYAVIDSSLNLYKLDCE